MLDSGLIVSPTNRIVDVAGITVAGGSINIYAAGTSTPLTVYSDSGLTVPIGSTVYLDSGGHPVAAQGSTTKVLVYTGHALIKMVVLDVNGVTIETYDNVKCAIDTTSLGTGTGGSGLISSIVSKTADFTVTTNDNTKLFNCDPTGGVFTATFPSAATAGDGFEFGIRHAGTSTTNVVKYAAVSNQTVNIDGTSTIAGALTNGGEEIWFTSNGASWVATAHISPRIVGDISTFTCASRLTAPPTSPTAGSYYIISGTPSGTWSALGFAAGDVVRADGQGNWIRWTPAADCGWLAYVRSEDVVYQYQTGGWIPWTNVTAPQASSLRSMLVLDSRNSGSVPGIGVASAWTKRVLQTVPYNTILVTNGASSNATLDSTNYIITLPTGQYWVSAIQEFSLTAASTSGVIRCRLRNLTTGAISYSSNEQVISNAASVSNSVTCRIDAFIQVVAATEQFVIEYYATNTPTLGVTLSLASVNEQFASVSIIDIGAKQGPQGQIGPQGGLGPGYLATSTSTITIASGTITLTTQSGLAYSVGQRVRVSSTADPTHYYMVGFMTAYNSVSGVMTLTADKTVGSGSFSAWSIGVDGEIGYPGTTVPDISGLSQKTLVDDVADWTIVYDAGASVHKKAHPKDLGYTASGGQLRSLSSKLGEIIHASDYSSINAAVTAIGSTAATLVVSTACTLTASLTIPATMTLEIRRGGSIVKASTFTLTINAAFYAGRYSVFTGFAKGNVTFGTKALQDNRVFPDWWGAAADGSTNDQTALDCAFGALAANSSHRVSLRGYYACTTGQFAIASSGNGVEGDNGTWSGILCSHASNTILSCVGASAVAPINDNSMRNFFVARTIQPTTGAIGIQLKWLVNFKSDRVYSTDSINGVSIQGVGSSTLDRMVCGLTNAVTTTATTYNPFLISGADANASLEFNFCVAYGTQALLNAGATILGFATSGTTLADLQFVNCYTVNVTDGHNMTSGAGNDGDIQWINCVNDSYRNSGYNLSSLSVAAGTELISGGWCAPDNAAKATSYGIKLTNCNGVRADSVQIVGSGGTYNKGSAQYAFWASGCSNHGITNSIIKGNAVGVYDSSSGVGLVCIGNTIDNAYAGTGAFTNAIGVSLNGSDRAIVVGNHIGNNGTTRFTQGVAADATTTNCETGYNTIGTSVTTPYAFTGAAATANFFALRTTYNPTAHGVVVAQGTGAATATAVGTNGQLLIEIGRAHV